jgi:hypothetical protein
LRVRLIGLRVVFLKLSPMVARAPVVVWWMMEREGGLLVVVVLI